MPIRFRKKLVVLFPPALILFVYIIISTITRQFAERSVPPTKDEIFPSHKRSFVEDWRPSESSSESWFPSKEGDAKLLSEDAAVSYESEDLSYSQQESEEKFTFGPYEGDFFYSACRRFREKRLECLKKISSRPLSALEKQGGDILFTLRTTVKYHAIMLPELFESWLRDDTKNVYIVSDGEDIDLQKRLKLLGMKYVVSPTGSTHNREDLCSKSGTGMEILLWPENSEFNWMCHVDDDIYINIDALVKALSHFDPRRERVYFGRSFNYPVKKNSTIGKPGRRFDFAVGGCYCLSRPMLMAVQPYVGGAEAFRESCIKADYPDDITLGLVVGAVLNEETVKTHMMYMHDFIPGMEKYVYPQDYQHQIAFAYGDGSFEWSNSPNVVQVPDALYDLKDDRSQFRSLHCYLHPNLQWCLNGKEEIAKQRTGTY